VHTIYTIIHTLLPGSTPPARISHHAVLSAATLAVIEWTVPLISFTPETYETQLVTDDDDPGLVQSLTVESTRNISAVNQRYQVVVEGLLPDNNYDYRILSSNQNGTIATNFNGFSTSLICKITMKLSL